MVGNWAELGQLARYDATGLAQLTKVHVRQLQRFSHERLGISPRVGRVGLPANAPSKAVNVNVGDYYDANRADFAHVPNSDHAFYFYDPTMLRDIHDTLKGELDRNVIPTRRLDSAGRLYLGPKI